MLKPSTLSFLTNLAVNNDRVWFAANKVQYEEAKQDVLDLATMLLKQSREIDHNIPSFLTPSKCLLRIYRDIRFSKDKRPYKDYFALWFPVHENADGGPGYYFHLHPDNSFFGAGYWMPSSKNLALIRQEIDYNAEAFLEIINEPYFANTFRFNWNASLVRPPKGFTLDHSQMKFLKLKSFEITTPINQLLRQDVEFLDSTAKLFEAAHPFVNFLKTAMD